MSKKRIAFTDAIEHSVNSIGLDPKVALAETQARYDTFMQRNQKLIERQNDQSNASQIQLISHFALLATLSLTVTGFLITQTAHELTNPQKNIILLIMSAQTVSLFFGAIDYWQTIKFHDSWARLYHKIGKEVNTKVASGEIQMINELGEIEEEYLKEQPESTKTWITFLMVFFCLAGLMLIILLFYAYFYDVPFWTN